MSPDAAPPLALEVAALVLLTALATLLAVASALLERSGPIRLRHWTREAGGRLQALYDSSERFEVYRYLLSLLAKAAPVGLFLALWSVARTAGAAPPALWAGLAVLVLLAFIELLNRLLVGRNPEAALRRLTPVYRFLLPLLRPVLPALRPLLSGTVQRQDDDEDEASEEEIEAFISVGTQEGIIEPGEEDLILRAIDFGDAVVRSVVTPRPDMVCAPVDSDLDALAELFLSSKHSRIPLYRRSVDEIVGVLHIRELLRALRSGEPRPSAAELAMPAYLVPETKPLDDLLREFQRQRQQMAIVVDEYGGTTGLVTVEDLLEEIVGEIVDEHEEVPPLRQPLTAGGWRLAGSTPLQVLTELYAVEVDGEPYTTVGGLIFDRLGNVPKPGDAVELLGLEFTVEGVEERRIQSVAVRPLEPPGGEGG